MNNAPDVCNARDRLTGETGRGLGGLVGIVPPSRPRGGISIPRSVGLCSSSSSAGDLTRTFLRGEDCNGEAAEEKECFRFRLGVPAKPGKPSFGLQPLPAFDLVNAGPRRLTAGEFKALKAWRLVFTLLALFPLLSIERGVKNRLKDRGVTGGGFLVLRRVPASDAIEGGDDGISWDQGGQIGSDRGTSGRPGTMAILRYGKQAETRKESNKDRKRVTMAKTLGGAKG